MKLIPESELKLLLKAKAVEDIMENEIGGYPDSVYEVLHEVNFFKNWEEECEELLSAYTDYTMIFEDNYNFD